MSKKIEQVGGNHYQSSYQHWKYVEEVGMGYLEGCATKYLPRWQSKGGVLDLMKGRSYVEELILQARITRENRAQEGSQGHDMVRWARFVKENSLSTYEASICLLLQIWTDDTELDAALQLFNAVIAAAKQDEEDERQESIRNESTFAGDAIAFTGDVIPSPFKPEVPNVETDILF